jgi:fructokinase
LIVVGGEALVDIIENVDGTQRKAPGGGPFNTVRALARLGVPTAFLGRLSDDDLGLQLAGLLAADGADLSLMVSGPEPTTTAVARVDGDGIAEYEFFTDGTSAPNLTEDMLPPELGPQVDAIHIGTLGLVLEPMASTLIELVRREAGRRLVMLDPNIRSALTAEREYRHRLEAVIAQSTILKVSAADLAWLYPTLDQEAAAEQLLTAGPRLVLVTLGTEGAFGATAGHHVRVSAPSVTVVDTIGAGDTFGAAVLAWLFHNDALRVDLSINAEELKSILDFACMAASLACTRQGAEPPWKAELDGALASAGRGSQ